MPERIIVRIKRRANRRAQPYFEEFEIPYKHQMNVISLLMEIQRNPVNREGKKVAPVVWESSCLEEVCGACTMVINGRVRQACSALVDKLSKPILLEPMTKFPPVRDLSVDRSSMFEDLKRVHAWISIDGTHDLGIGPRRSEAETKFAYELSRCMTCGCCLEACPQVNDRSDFMGAAILSQVVLFNSHPTGKMNRGERLDQVMGKGGITDCGNAQVCEKVCPKEIPLLESLALLARETTLYGISRFFREKS